MNVKVISKVHEKTKNRIKPQRSQRLTLWTRKKYFVENTLYTDEYNSLPRRGYIKCDFKKELEPEQK